MFRYLVLPTLAALLLAPDWASAFFRRKAAKCPAVPAQKVQYAYVPQCPPMFLAPVPCCPPAVVAPATVKPATPQVVPERMATPKPVAPDVITPTPTPTPKPSPTPTPTTIPTPEPNLKPEKLVEPKLPSLIPNGESKLLPEPAPVNPVVPVVPVEAIKPVVAVEEKLPPIDVPLTPSPALPKLSLEPIPAKDVASDEKAIPVKPDSTLPKLELPGLDLPVAPPLAVPKEVEVKSSPINAEKNSVAYEMFPVDGQSPANRDEKRIVTFYNFSGRDLLLTIDGKSYTLPAKHTVEGKLGAQFKMQIGIGEVQEMKVPMSAAGVDVVLKK